MGTQNRNEVEELHPRRERGAGRKSAVLREERTKLCACGAEGFAKTQLRNEAGLSSARSGANMQHVRPKNINTYQKRKRSASGE